MRLTSVVAFVGTALIGYAPSASASVYNCPITITFRNDGATSHTFYRHWARTRMRVGVWVRLWPNQEPIMLAPGESSSLSYWAEECERIDFRAFEFHIDPAACGSSAPSDAWWLTGGGGGLRKLLNRELPAAGQTVKIRIPNTGFTRQDVWATIVNGENRYDRNHFVVDIGNLTARCPSAPR